MIPLSAFQIFVIFFCVLYYYFFSKRKYNLPPGPWNPFPKPLQSYLTYQSWAKEYGHIFQTKFGLWNAVIVDDPKLVRQAFSNPVISDRMDHKVFGALSDRSGITNANGQEWMEQRRFVLRTLRDFGFGKQSIEGFIMEEVHELLNWMKTNEGVPICIERRFVLATVNALWMLIAGQRNEQDNELLDAVMEKVTDRLVDSLGTGSPLLSYPQIIDILPKMFLKKWTLVQESVKPFLKIFQDSIDFHIQNPVPEAQPRDLIDSYLTEVKRTTDIRSPFYGDKGEKSLLAAVADLYGAGQATTSTTLSWAVLYLIRFPEVQQKLQQELDSIVGHNRQPTLDDRPNLPFTSALMMEILRYSSIVPLGVFHETTQDTTLGGYDIKKGTVIVPNLYSIHFSKEIWEDPEDFRPERFLSFDGKKFIKSENLIPFSVGRRVCLGESLAMDNFFLFLTNIFQRFEIMEDPAQPTPTLDSKDGFLRQPHKYSVIMKDRVN